MESELEISRKLITRFVKRMYTDKVSSGRLAVTTRRAGGCVSIGMRIIPAVAPPRSLFPLLARAQVIIAFTFLVICGIVGIIVYSTLNPNQKIFNVPDAAKPAIPGVSVSYSPTASPSPAAPVRRLLRAAGGDAATATSTLTSAAAAHGSALAAAVRRALAAVWRAAAAPSSAATGAAARAAPALRGGGGVAGGGAG